MRWQAAAAIAGSVLSHPAWAQDAPPEPEEPRWTASLSAGTSLTGGSSDQWSAGAELVRALGDGFAALSLTRIEEDGERGVIGAAPSTTVSVGLAGGYSFGALGIEFHGSYGWREFGERSFAVGGGQAITSGGEGKSLGFGGSLSHDFVLGPETVLSPSVSVDFDRTDLARFVALPVRGPVLVTQREKGITGSVGITLGRTFGAGGRHRLGLTIAYSATSNAAAGIGSVNFGRVSRPLRRRGVAGGEDDWLDYGAEASFALAARLDLTLSASRTRGRVGPESTGLSAGLQFRF